MTRLHSLAVIGMLGGLLAPCVALARLPPQTSIQAVATDLPVAMAKSSASASPSDWRADIRRYAARMVHAGFFPGMQIAVTRGDQVVYVGSFGVADDDTGRRVDDSTRFYIASTTKALTATAVMLEASRGMLQLDTPVTRYVPNLRFKAPLRANAVTVRNLLSMTDGIDDCLPVVFRTAFSGVFTQPGLIQLMQQCGPAEGGHAFSYRNLPYNLLGIVLAPDSKNGWKAVVRKQVLEPLGMSETTARVSTLQPAQIAMPHEATEDGFARLRLAKADANLHAAGGYFSSARDLARFVAVHACDGRLEGRRIFPAGVIASTHAKHASQDRKFGPYHRSGWGFGWDLATYDGRTLVQRFGAFAGYRSHASFMPDTGVGVVVLVNGVAAPFAADEMANYIYDRLDGDRMDVAAAHEATFRQLEKRRARFGEHFVKHQATVRERAQKTLPHPLRAYAGRYENPLLGAMIFQVSAGRLDVSIGVAKSRADIYDAAKNELRVQLTGSGQVVHFRFPQAAGSAIGVEFNGYHFERVDAGESESRTITL